jgi:geranylgeranyl diphosphate synthase, type II
VMEAEASFKRYREMTEGILRNWYEERAKRSTLGPAIEYVLFPGGKKVRSCFALGLLEDLGVDIDPFLPAVAALELLHAASLIHDDLPALDNDDMRRGRPSCHKQFSEATAILCADYLIAAAFGLVARPSSSIRHYDLSTLFSEAFCHLCEGQHIDTTCADSHPLLTIHQLKTGALFRCAAGIAAHYYREDVYLFENIKQFGLWVGVGFQIMDDFIDSDPTLKGRDRSSDRENQKVTFNDDRDADLEGGITFTMARIKRYYESIHDKTGRELSTIRAFLVALFRPIESVGANFT